MPEQNRRIKSFVKRAGKMSQAQKDALTQKEKYQIKFDGKLTKEQLTKQLQKNQLVLDIGFGMGDGLAGMCIDYPDVGFVGVEVFDKGIGAIIRHAETTPFTNIAIHHGDAVELINQTIENTFDRVQVFFPDPWHKKSHHKRRLLTADFLQKVHKILKPEGILHIKTDWQDYADFIQESINATNSFIKMDAKNNTSMALEIKTTKFEKRGIRLGHNISEFQYINKPNNTDN